MRKGGGESPFFVGNKCLVSSLPLPGKLLTPNPVSYLPLPGKLLTLIRLAPKVDRN